MMEKNEQETLAILRTLLALERNSLAEERVCLAELRTGLPLSVLGPTMGTILAYLFSSLALREALLYDLVTVLVFSIVTVLGFRMTLRSRSKLKKIRKMKYA